MFAWHFYQNFDEYVGPTTLPRGGLYFGKFDDWTGISVF